MWAASQYRRDDTEIAHLRKYAIIKSAVSLLNLRTEREIEDYTAKDRRSTFVIRMADSATVLPSCCECVAAQNNSSSIVLRCSTIAQAADWAPHCLSALD